jgi:hypothetical protein
LGMCILSHYGSKFQIGFSLNNFKNWECEGNCICCEAAMLYED